jgi:hypothetical protein
MSLALTTPGRLGFYLDYSERTTPGDHTFYPRRTHGSAGAVGCTWTAYDASGQLDTGTLSWDDESLDIKTITVNIPSKSDGDHRCWVILSAPTGGAVLHHNVTIAYGVIDDDTISVNHATDSLFIDVAAVGGGTGTQGDPFNGWPGVVNNITSSIKYVYIKGQITPDGTYTNPGGTDTNTKYLQITTAFAGRTSESDRLVIRNWPGFVGGLDGNGDTGTAGFGCFNDGIDYITTRRLTVNDLDTSGGSSTATTKCFYMWPKGQQDYWTTERVDIDGVNSLATSATAAYYTDGTSGNGRLGHKLWRVTGNNITYNNGANKLNFAETYNSADMSFQRCTLGTNCGEIYQKQGQPLGAALSISFCLIQTGHIRMSTQGSWQCPPASIIEHNVFDTPGQTSLAYPPIRYDNNGSNTTASDKHWIVGNVFYNFPDYSTSAVVDVWDDEYTNVVMLMNIFDRCHDMWQYQFGVTITPEISDYQQLYDNVSTETVYVSNTNYSGLANIQGAGYEANSNNTDPQLTNPGAGDFTLGGGSPCIAAGIPDGLGSNIDMGAYPSGVEVVGA